jgi:hypothetical protein
MAKSMLDKKVRGGLVVVPRRNNDSLQLLNVAGCWMEQIVRKELQYQN